MGAFSSWIQKLLSVNTEEIIIWWVKTDANRFPFWIEELGKLNGLSAFSRGIQPIDDYETRVKLLRLEARK